MFGLLKNLSKLRILLLTIIAIEFIVILTVFRMNQIQQRKISLNNENFYSKEKLETPDILHLINKETINAELKNSTINDFHENIPSIKNEEIKTNSTAKIALKEKLITPDILNSINHKEPVNNNERTNLTLKDLHEKIWSQIRELQEEGDCESKKILFCENKGNFAGLGSMSHRYGACMQIAFGLGRIWFINQPQYNHFGGLTKYLQLESTKCDYLKEKYKSSKEIVDIEDRTSYMANGYDTNNSHKVMRYSSIGKFPHPRHIPTTLPYEIEQSLASLNVDKPWLWFTSQFLGYLFLRPNENFQKIIQNVRNTLSFPYTALHIRRGDKIKSKEAKLIPETKYLNASQKYFDQHYSNDTEKFIYLASDDTNMKSVLEKLAPKQYQIRTKNTENNRNDLSSLEKNGLMILDLYLLAYSNYTVCTFSSNVGRLVYELKQNIPPYNAFNQTISLDYPDEMVYLWQGYSNYWIRHFYRTTSNNNQERKIDGLNLLTYDENARLDFNNKTYTFHENGREVKIGHVWTIDKKTGKNTNGYVYFKHFMKWPGHPKYHFY